MSCGASPKTPIFRNIPASGLILTILDMIRLGRVTAKLEDWWGGRVGALLPKGNIRGQDPFVLFAHHRHTFWPLDPIRPLAKLIVPEGFPAHAHRGFQTVTYVLRVSQARPLVSEKRSTAVCTCQLCALSAHGRVDQSWKRVHERNSAAVWV